MLVQILLNVHRAEHTTPMDLDDVMLALGHRPEEPPPPPPTVEQLHDQFALLADVFRGNGQIEG